MAGNKQPVYDSTDLNFVNAAAIASLTDSSGGTASDFEAAALAQYARFVSAQDEAGAWRSFAVGMGLANPGREEFTSYFRNGIPRGARVILSRNISP